MVKNEDMRGQGSFSRKVSRYVAGMLSEQGVKQRHIQERLQRSQAYVSERVNGHKSWTLDELDSMAGLLGFSSGMTMMAEIGERAILAEQRSDELAERRKNRKPPTQADIDEGRAAAYRPKYPHQPLDRDPDSPEI